MVLSLCTLTLHKYYQIVKVKIQFIATRIEDAIFSVKGDVYNTPLYFLHCKLMQKYKTHKCQPLLNIFYMFSANSSISSFHSLRELLENKLMTRIFVCFGILINDFKCETSCYTYFKVFWYLFFRTLRRRVLGMTGRSREIVGR